MYMYVPGLAQAGGARKSRTLAVTRAPKWDCFFSGVDLNSGQVGDSRVCAAWHRPGELCPWRDRECEHSTPSLENQGQSPQQKTSPCPFPKSSTQAVLCVLCTSRSPDRPRTTLGLPAAETVLLSLHLGVCEKGIETRTLLGHSQRHGQPCRHVWGTIRERGTGQGTVEEPWHTAQSFTQCLYQGLVLLQPRCAQQGGGEACRGCFPAGLALFGHDSLADAQEP